MIFLFIISIILNSCRSKVTGPIGPGIHQKSEAISSEAAGYDFEDPVQVNDWITSELFTAVEYTSKKIYSGKGSMRILFDPVAVSDMTGNIHINPARGINLADKTVSVYIWFPAEAIGTNTTSPNGFQFFIKNSVWGYADSAWNNLTSVHTDTWTKFEWHITTNSSSFNYMASNFDPGDVVYIMEIGIVYKVISADNRPSSPGYIYIDDFTW